jgi:dTDP-4-dehydrorhamnose 3,5-epimerase
VTDSTIPGVRYLRIARHDDARGSFREVWRASTVGSDGSAPFVQANLSVSEPGALRGLHYHQRQLDYWTVTTGRAFVALVDIRPLLVGGRGRPVVESRVLGADDAVVVPAGVGHGFLALERLELLYLVTNEYNGSDELGFAWDDPTLAIPWPLAEIQPGGAPILSDRDRRNPTLAEVVARLPLRDHG